MCTWSKSPAIFLRSPPAPAVSGRHRRLVLPPRPVPAARRRAHARQKPARDHDSGRGAGGDLSLSKRPCPGSSESSACRASCPVRGICPTMRRMPSASLMYSAAPLVVAADLRRARAARASLSPCCESKSCRVVPFRFMRVRRDHLEVPLHRLRRWHRRRPSEDRRAGFPRRDH